MEESTRLTNARTRPSRSNNNNINNSVRGEFGDDECSTDSGCSSGGSTGSAERLSRRGSGERLCSGGRSPRASHCYLNNLRGNSTATRSQDRLSRGSRSSDRCGGKSSRSWSPGDARISAHHESPSHSPSLSDAHSSDSDSTKRCSTTETLRKAFQSLKISSRRETKDKKHGKKSPKSILRSPVSYTYVRGLSGLPTHRVPRNSTPQSTLLPCTCQEMIGLNR